MPTAEQLGITDVLDTITSRFGIEGIERGDEFDFICPAPGHNESKAGSCSVNLTSGLWKCLACGTAGDIITLGTLLLGDDYGTVRASLQPSTPEALGSTVRAKLAVLLRRPEASKPVELKEYRRKALGGELKARGFTDHTLRWWGVRYVETEILQGKKGDFTIGHSYAIPIRDHDHNLLAWCYRRTNRSPEWQPRYLYTPNVSLSELWFGPSRWYHNTDHITIVEGALDAMWLDQAGIPAWALLGSEMGKRKLSMLKGFKTVTLFGDLDAAGMLAVNRIGDAIADSTRVKVVTYPKRIVDSYDGKLDPGALDPIDVELLVDQAIPWTTWLQRRNA